MNTFEDEEILCLKSGQYGKLVILNDTEFTNIDDNTGSFKIIVLPENIEVTHIEEAYRLGIEVYGLLSKWWDFKKYGWIHKGKWRDDVLNLVHEHNSKIERLEQERKQRELDILSKY